MEEAPTDNRTPQELEREQRMMLEQHEAARAAIWEQASPAATATGPGNLEDRGYQGEIYRRAFVAARSVAPNFTDEYVNKLVEADMTRAFGSYYHRGTYYFETDAPETGDAARRTDDPVFAKDAFDSFSEQGTTIDDEDPVVPHAGSNEPRRTGAGQVSPIDGLPVGEEEDGDPGDAWDAFPELPDPLR